MNILGTVLADLCQKVRIVCDIISCVCVCVWGGGGGGGGCMVSAEGVWGCCMFLLGMIFSIPCRIGMTVTMMTSLLLRGFSCSSGTSFMLALRLKRKRSVFG